MHYEIKVQHPLAGIRVTDVAVVGQVAAGKVCFLSTALAVPMATASIREQASLHPLLMFVSCAGNGGRTAGKNR